MKTPDTQLIEAAQKCHLVIAIDGPAGSGKSTVGRNLAKALECPYVDTGLMYRAVTLLALQRGIDLESPEALESLAAALTFDMDRETGSLLIDGLPPDPLLRSPQVDAAVSVVSAHPGVRSHMVDRQRELVQGTCIIMVGRDIGTVVLPDASVKLWVTASPEQRARRRLAEHLPGAESATIDDMVRQISARDAFDSSRELSPLRRAEDSIDINTNELSEDEALAMACDVVRSVVHEARPERSPVRR